MEEQKKDIQGLNEEQRKDLLKLLIKQTLEEKKTVVEDAPNKITLLQQLRESYEDKNSFNAGDVVRWKNKLKNRKLPDYNEPGIIIEVLKEPIINSNEPFGSTYFYEKYDIKVGVLREDSMLTFLFDSSRFELYK